VSDVFGLVYTSLSFVLGAVISILIKKFQEYVEWAETRKATYDLIANDLAAIGYSGNCTFFRLIKEYPKVSEFTIDLQETHHPSMEASGEYEVAANALGNAIWWPAQMLDEVRHGDRLFSLTLSQYTKIFYAESYKNIDNVRSNIRVLISIPGDMKVKKACVRFEHAATRMSWAVNEYTKLEQTPPIRVSLRFLGEAVALCEALNEATAKPGINDRLNKWWLTGE
jgi:hypothetical protein